LSQAMFKGSVDSEEVQEMLKGVRQLAGYFLGSKFIIDHAKVAAGKAAVLASVLKYHNTPEIDDLRYNDTRISQIKDVTLGGQFQILNKLKSTNIEAFYYWWLVQNMAASLT
jgi:hypothetical protein